MDIQISTYNRACLTEVTHMDIIKLPEAVAYLLRDHMGASYAGNSSMNRWAGCFHVPAAGEPVRVPFELVICDRGSSIRCSWLQGKLVRDILERMVPEIIAEVIAVPMVAR